MSVGIAMIMYGQLPVLSLENLQAKLAKNWPDLPACSESESKDDSLSFQLGQHTVVMATMPAGIPWSDLEGPCATSILWPDAASELQDHPYHVIVTLLGAEDPIERSRLLTQICSAVMLGDQHALGVFWGNASLIIPAGLFNDFATQVLPEELPLYIWVDVRVGMGEGESSSGFTTGMDALGHMELEAEHAAEPPGELRERLYALAGYLLENGPVINDGDTVGEDQHEKIRIVYSDSTFGHQQQVMRLVYEKDSPQKPWWKLW